MKISKGLMAVMGLVLVGCNNYSSPEAVIGSAGKAMEKGDLKNFSRAFTRAYRKSHDMAQIMSETSAALGHDVNGLVLGKPEQLRADTQRKLVCDGQLFGEFRDVPTRVLYSTQALRAGQVLLTIEVDCQQLYHERHARYTVGDRCYEYSGENCKISDLR